MKLSQTTNPVHLINGAADALLGIPLRFLALGLVRSAPFQTDFCLQVQGLPLGVSHPTLDKFRVNSEERTCFLHPFDSLFPK